LVFTRSGGHWTQDKKLVGPGAVGKSTPSVALSADGNIVMVGGSNDNGGVEPIGHDGDGVALTLIVANEHRAGFERAPGRAAMARQTVQELQAVPIKAAKGLFLHAPG